jgi:hypothetical protein
MNESRVQLSALRLHQNLTKVSSLVNVYLIDALIFAVLMDIMWLNGHHDGTTNLNLNETKFLNKTKIQL